MKSKFTQKDMIYLVLVLVTINLVGYFGVNFVAKRSSDMVIERLKKSYSPSPYGPGFNPDLVPTDISKIN